MRYLIFVANKSDSNETFREMDLMLVPYSADRSLNLIQWPPFLLASKVHLLLFNFSVCLCENNLILFKFICNSLLGAQIPIAVSMAQDSLGKGQELEKRLSRDKYMKSAVEECYASFKSIINFLVLGERETM